MALRGRCEIIKGSSEIRKKMVLNCCIYFRKNRESSKKSFQKFDAQNLKK
jgi:hypothetical protein